nr:MAG TPA: hypothetical protein [Caudoviricetes sp.]
MIKNVPTQVVELVWGFKLCSIKRRLNLYGGYW